METSLLPNPINVQLTSIRYSSQVKKLPFSKLTSIDIEYFRNILTTSGILQHPQSLLHYNVDCYRMFRGHSNIVLFPKETTQLTQILKYCHQRNLAVTPQGGNTGLVGGGIPVFDEIIIRMDHMNQIKELDEVTGNLTTQAGVTLKSLRQFVEDKGYLVPLDLATEEYCQIGANVATNAGGLKYFRYGSLHSNILGLEVVLANGDILDLMNSMSKDNTGYDLKQILIGSEGTLGIITKVIIRCPLKSKSTASLLFGMTSFPDIITTFKNAKVYFGDMLTCCELMDKECMTCLFDNEALENPLGHTDSIYFILLEVSTIIPKQESDMKVFLEAFVRNGPQTVFIATSAPDINKLWKLRRGIGMAVLKDGYAYKYDFSIPLGTFHCFIQDIRRELIGSNAKRACIFGHLGDNNIHLVVTSSAYDALLTKVLEPFVYDWVKGVGGSISGEHGIGFRERKYLTHSKSTIAIDLMKKFKDAFDPKGILNPYKIFLQKDS